MVVEQRIGRIDRIGQNSKVIHIFTLIVKGSIQETINDRLLSRIEVFRTTIGDLEPILSANYDKDSTIEDAIKDLYQTELSPEQLEAKLSRIERAIERNMEDSKRLEKELQVASYGRFGQPEPQYPRLYFPSFQADTYMQQPSAVPLRYCRGLFSVGGR